MYVMYGYCATPGFGCRSPQYLRAGPLPDRHPVRSELGSCRRPYRQPGGRERSQATHAVFSHMVNICC